MGVTNQKSDQVTNATASPYTPNPAYYVGGKVRTLYFKHTQSGAGDNTSDALIAYIPAGQGVVLKTLCHWRWTAFGAGRTIDIGYGAHTKRDGTAVSAGLDVFADGVDVENADTNGAVMAVGTNADDNPFWVYDSKAPIPIYATSGGSGTWPDGAVIEGVLFYVSNE